MQNYGIKERSIPVSIILSIVTCGIYAIYWFICVTDDMGKLSNDARLSGGKCFLFTLVTCGLYGIYWAYLMGKASYNAKTTRNLPASDNSVIYLILEIFGLGIIVYALAQNEINDMVKAN